MNIEQIIDESIQYSRSINVNSNSKRKYFWSKFTSLVGSKDVCEVGVSLGQFSEVMLQENPDIETYNLIDPWRNMDAWDMPGNVTQEKLDEYYNICIERLEPFKDKTVFNRGTTKEVIHNIADKSLDYAYIDGDHTLRGITIDLQLMLPKMKEGGYIGGDDMFKNVWQISRDHAPCLVFPYVFYFAEANDLKIHTLPHNQYLMYNDWNCYELVDNYGYSQLTSRQIFQ